MTKARKKIVRKKVPPKKATSADTSKPKERHPKRAGTESGRAAKSVANASAESSQRGPSGGPGLLLNLACTALPTRERPFIVEYFPTPQQIAAEYEVRYEELKRQHEAATAVLETIRDEWKAKALNGGQVVSLNVDYRTKFREVVAPLQYVIQVDVPRKQHEALLQKQGMFFFPRMQDGVPVKVREARAATCLGQAKAMAGQTGRSFARLNQIGGGAAIGSDAFPGEFGTLGMCLPNDGGDLHGMTNAHVAGTIPGPNVYQPPANPNNAADLVGTVITAVFNNLCDAALFDGSALQGSRSLIREIPGLLDSSGNPFPPNEYRFLKLRTLKSDSSLLNKVVIKAGAASDVTRGFINNPCKESPTVAHLPPNTFNSVFADVIAIKNFVDLPYLMGGDSGSLAVYIATEGGTSFPVVIGLNVATLEDGGKESYAFPFGRVMRSLKIDNLIPDNRKWAPAGE